jgi:hypothetical protein
VFCTLEFDRAKLTDEHIIPEAIHGSLVLERGACYPCAGRTNKDYENEALNHDLQIARFSLNLRGKTKSAAVKEARHLPPVYAGGDITRRDPGKRLTLTLDEYPKSFCLIDYVPAGFLCGTDRGSSLPTRRWKVCVIQGGKPDVMVQQKTIDGKFAKMLAKIGYCYAVAELGINGFDGGDIRSLLQGKRKDVYNFVGGRSQHEDLPRDRLHALYLRRRGVWQTVLVHLFASLEGKDTPPNPYEVVVGKAA